MKTHRAPKHRTESKSPIPSNERERLDALYRLIILDTARDERFDRIVRAVSTVFDAPISTLTFVDKDREWYKASYGVRSRQGPRDVSFCTHAMVSKGTLVIRDTLKDPRFKNNPMVIGPPYVRFYAGHPIYSPDGFRVGTLCVKDTKPRDFHKRDIEILQHFASWAESELYYQTSVKDLDSQVKEKKVVLNSLGEGVFRVNVQGIVKYMNSSAMSMLGFKKDPTGQEFIDAWSLEDKEGRLVELSRRPLRVAMDESRVVQEDSFYFKRSNGTRFPIATRAQPFFEGGRLEGAIEVFRDISEAVRIEEAKANFLSLVSHQLRTPLSIVKWYSERLGNKDSLNAEQRMLVAEISRSNLKTIELVDTIIGVTGFQLGHVGLKPSLLVPSEVVGLILKDLKPLIDVKELQVVMRCASDVPNVTHDYKAFRIVMENVITNAIQYSPRKARVTIAATRDSGNLLITVKDNGCGIPKDEQASIFTRMFRASNARALEPRGTGLGLYLSKSLIESSGGRIWFTSKVGFGTTFYLSWPIRKRVPIKK